MQERQTQVLALPARVDGRERETEGILGGVPLCAHGRTLRYSQKFPPVPRRDGRRGSMPDARRCNRAVGGVGGGERERCCRSAPLSLPRRSVASELPPSAARPPSSTAGPLAPSLSLAFTHFAPPPPKCGNFIPWTQKRGVGGGSLAPLFFLFPSHNSTPG